MYHCAKQTIKWDYVKRENEDKPQRLRVLYVRNKPKYAAKWFVILRYFKMGTCHTMCYQYDAQRHEIVINRKRIE